ncbi:MAG: ABC transporter ATP-binding protein [Myxococcales bacterium]|nr:ABC transporter ATP-binding protein [Myxococcales bacterium]
MPTATAPRTSAPAPLRALGLGRALGSRVLYRGLDRTLEASTVTVLVGPNGAGKSTLLRDLAGLRAPAEGRVTLGGADLHRLAPGERARQIAYLPQHTPLAHDLGAAEVVMLGRTPYLGRFTGPGPEDTSVVAAALARVGLADAARRRLSTLSGGERQRVMLARMLATGAPILLLDEPCAGLDIGHALAFLALCRDLARGGATVLVALHDLDLARAHADHALVLGDPAGRVVAGEAAAVLAPATLGPLFGVEISEVGGHLICERALEG